MAQNDAALERLAEALLALGEASGELGRLERELSAVLDLLDSREDVRRFLGDPGIDDRGKCAALERLFGETLHPALLHFLLIVQRQHLLPRLGKVAEAFFARVSRLGRRVAGELIAARPVAEERVAQIEREVGRILDKDVHLAVRVDREMLGGVIVRVGSFVMDGSVERMLESLGRALRTGGSTGAVPDMVFSFGWLFSGRGVQEADVGGWRLGAREGQAEEI